MTTYCIQGNVIDRSNTAGANGRGWSEEVSYTLNVVDRPAVACLNNIGGGMTGNEAKVYDSQIYHDFREMTDVCQSVHAQYGTGGNNMPFVVNERGNDSAPAEDQVAVLQGLGDYKMDNVASALKQRDYKDATDLVCGEDEEVIRTVRRLTPLECTRLQGYPDGWVDIPGATDSKKYKALGNSICLPFWEWLARRFTQYGNVRTIGSLFAGIGGFELVFHRAGCETLWNSEIDNFCQQVVKYHHDKGEI